MKILDHFKSKSVIKQIILRLIWENEELKDSLRFGALDEYHDLFTLVSLKFNLIFLIHLL